MGNQPILKLTALFKWMTNVFMQLGVFLVTTAKIFRSWVSKVRLLQSILKFLTRTGL